MSTVSWLLSLDEARAKCEAWRRDYNEVRPHSAIGNKTPMELHRMAASPASQQSDEARISSPGWSKDRGKFRSENFLARAVQGWGQGQLS